MLPKISQGVTTVVAGNCGISLAPVTFDGAPPAPLNLLGGKEAYAFPTFADYARAIAETTPGVNVAALIGHSSLRLATMTDIAGKADESEIAAMLDHVDEAMANGAAGFSTGLFYPTNAGADADEVTRIATRFSERGGVYATHMRDETAHVLDSIAESVETAKRAGIQLVISHHKCAGLDNWGRTRETLPVIRDAAARQPVALDAYPYAAGSTNLRDDLVTDALPDHDLVVRSPSRGRWTRPRRHRGRLGRRPPRGRPPPRPGRRDLLPDGRGRRPPRPRLPADHDRFRRSAPRQASAPAPVGTFPRVIGHYARELGLFPIEIAIHKMTGLTAKVFNLEGRGRIAEGCFADLVVFDPATVVDRATYEDPQQFSAGIEKVFVNGKLSWEAGATSVRRNGRLVGGRTA